MLRESNSGNGGNWRALHFEKKQGAIEDAITYAKYLLINSNFQTRLLTEGLGGTGLKIH